MSCGISGVASICGGWVRRLGWNDVDSGIELVRKIAILKVTKMYSCRGRLFVFFI